MKLRKWLAVAFALTAITFLAGGVSAMSHEEGEQGEHEEHTANPCGENPCGEEANPCGGEEANPCGGDEAENPCGE